MANQASPENFRIAAQQKKAVERVDLMASGVGIPWEDRGSVGFVGAFLQTAFGAMFKPASLLAKLRRPETTTDANIFAYACGGIWFVAVLIQSAFAYYVFYNTPKVLEVDPQQYLLNTLLEGLVVGAGAVMLPRVVAWMFYRLTAFDMTSKAPPVLVYNIIVYLMGSSLLALIPGGPKSWLAIGPILAVVWMFMTLLVVAVSRLRISIGAAIIGTILTFLGTVAAIIAGYFAISLLWGTLLDKGSMTPVAPPTSVHPVS